MEVVRSGQLRTDSVCILRCSQKNLLMTFMFWCKRNMAKVFGLNK